MDLLNGSQPIIYTSQCICYLFSHAEQHELIRQYAMDLLTLTQSCNSTLSLKNAPRWKFCRVVCQQVWGNVASIIPSFSSTVSPLNAAVTELLNLVYVSQRVRQTKTGNMSYDAVSAAAPRVGWKTRFPSSAGPGRTLSQWWGFSQRTDAGVHRRESADVSACSAAAWWWGQTEEHAAGLTPTSHTAESTHTHTHTYTHT